MAVYQSIAFICIDIVVNIFIKVDFPAPLGPKKPTISPLLMENEMLSSAFEHHSFWICFYLY
jgi:hypothetical protein